MITLMTKNINDLECVLPNASLRREANVFPVFGLYSNGGQKLDILDNGHTGKAGPKMKIV